MSHTERDEITAGDTATETHHEPHGGAMPHGAADDIAEHGQGHHESTSAVGPIDTRLWGAAVLGIALGLVIAICFFVATTGVRA